MLQKDEEAKHIGIARLRHAEFLLLSLTVFGERILDRAKDRGGQQVVGAALVIEAALQGPVCADEAVQRLQDIAVDHALNPHGGVKDGEGEEGEQLLVGTQQFLGDLDIAVGEFGGVGLRRLLVPSCLPEEFAIQRAIHRDLAFGAATQGANLTVHTRTETSRTAGLTNCALHFLSIEGG